MPDHINNELIAAIEEKMRLHLGVELEDANRPRLFRACALMLRDIMQNRYVDAVARSEKTQERRVHYLSLEFLLGRSLEKNAFNFGIHGELCDAIHEIGFEPDDIFETEPDAALGNGGLGRLAACYIDAMTTLNIPADGYSILYQNGIFRQKIIDGGQMEIPEQWLHLDDVWFIQRMGEARKIRFGGTVEYHERNGRIVPVYKDTTEVLAVPMDMPITGYHTDRVNRLRLWTARSANAFDMKLFSAGEYLKAIEERALAEVLSQVLYPADNHSEGKSLRLKQQYFFVSATVQNIVREHRLEYGSLQNFHLKHILQINDTHPAIGIAELMRILLDEEGYGWEDAWHITSRSFAYTNHTVMSEALECWPQSLMQTVAPRIHDILCEINNRFLAEVRARYPGDEDRARRVAVLWDGQFRMANLCTHACLAVNGVSGLHTEILKERVFKDIDEMYPGRIVPITNGIDHRRWLAQANPRLTALVTDLIGDGFMTDAEKLRDLDKYKNDRSVLKRLAVVKASNKQEFAQYVKDTTGIILNPDSIFDVQVKRIHEYKRQLLNVMHIVYLYHKLKENPGMDFVPRSFIFGGKAAPGYYMAKEIIRLICSLQAQINGDPAMKDKLAVVFVENYRVFIAEKLMPASEISEQISLAGTEASGTGNMKFMLNGALTVGTLDGANVEMCEQVGEENMFLFGLLAEEAEEMARYGSYEPIRLYESDPELKAVVDRIRAGFDAAGAGFGDIASSLLIGDQYRHLKDFDSYRRVHERVAELYRQPEVWNSMSLQNIAGAGYFAADRSVKEYAEKIWKVPTRQM
ncbi:glycogen/starch/alpha-glucan phosphorylase [Oscillospiraceae bacterium OttesenSCG-928-F05]|nr:glycogen/starch/alpha-glucan phosphorylase [Oscillospiraceae bacterium OttesenSCG-928-F05]